FTVADKRPPPRGLRRLAISAKSWSNATERELVRAYNLTYYPERGMANVAGEAPLWGRSSLKSVTLEGRCATPVLEYGGYLPDPTGCPSLPAMSFEYQAAQLASGTAIYTFLDGPGTSDGLPYLTSSAVININRDGWPHLAQARPTNYDTSSYHFHYGECSLGVGQHFVVGGDLDSHEPQLICYIHREEYDNQVVRSARQNRAWKNRGIPLGTGGLTLEHHCLDAGGIEPGTLTHYQIHGPGGFVSRDPSLFTQYGAEAVGEWGNGSILWSLAGYHGFGITTGR